MKQLPVLILIAIFPANLIGQVHWNKYLDNPVMLSGRADEWDKLLNSPSTVLYKDSSYHMWYWGGDYNNQRYPIGYASSPDGITWTKDALNNPVLKPGPEGAWDDFNIRTPSVLFIDSTYHMWYRGYMDPDNCRIGHATSSNGVDWTKDTLNNPVLDIGSAGSWDDKIVGDVAVIHDGSKFHMWYAGGRTYDFTPFGHATSSDGSNWTRDSLNPVLMPGLNGEERGIEWLTAVYDGSVFHLWYHSGDVARWAINYATSLDGSHWIKDNHNPVFKGTPGSWDANSIMGTAIIDSAHVKFKMWYGGYSSNSIYTDIGYAESSPFVEIPDTAFLYALIEVGVDTNGDSLISYEEAESILSLDVSENGITDMTGIEAFVKLDTLYCVYNSLSSLDVSNNALTELNCSSNQLTSLDVSNNVALTELLCDRNQLTSLDVSGCTALQHLDCIHNQLTSLNVSSNTALEILSIGSSFVMGFCFGNLLTSLDVSNNTALQSLSCSCNQLTSLDVSNNTDLQWLSCDFNQLASLDVSNNSSLIGLECSGNQLTSLDLASNTAIENLVCEGNQFANLNLSNNSSLNYIVIAGMSTLYEVCVWTMPFPPSRVSVDAWNSPNIEFKDCSATGIEEYNQSGLNIYPNPSNNLLNIETEYPDHYSIEIISLNGQQILIGEMEGTTHQIDLSSFQKGAYFITIRSEDYVATRKIIKL